MKPEAFLLWTKAGSSVWGILLPCSAGLESGISAATSAAVTVHLQGHLAFRRCITVPANLALLGTLDFLNSLMANDFSQKKHNLK